MYCIPDNSMKLTLSFQYALQVIESLRQILKYIKYIHFVYNSNLCSSSSTLLKCMVAPSAFNQNIVQNGHIVYIVLK